MQSGKDSRDLWRQYLDSLSDPADAEGRFYETFRIGDSVESADAGAALIRDGTKTATSALLWQYQADDQSLPREGSLSVVENGCGEPVCIVETLQVEIRRFAAVDAGFARDYGEWDRTLETWRSNCWAYYSARCRELDREPSQEMPLVCERFRVVYP
jgi:uncharacterized protein YhfF